MVVDDHRVVGGAEDVAGDAMATTRE